MKRLRTLLAYDLRHGIGENVWKYLLLTGLGIVGMWSFGEQYLPYVEHGILSHKATAADQLANLFWGAPPLAENRDLRNDIPILWLLIMIIFTTAVGYYLYQQGEGFGRIILLKGESRTAWWLSKCIWCTMSATLALASLMIGILISGIFQGISWGAVSWDILRVTKGMQGQEGGAVESMLLVTVLPFLILAATALWQQVLSMIIQPLVALLLIVAYYLAASFYDSPLLLGTYITFCRSKYVVNGGWSLGEGVCVGAVAYILAIFIGIVVVKRRDFLQRHQI